jgi:hypothetical protein
MALKEINQLSENRRRKTSAHWRRSTRAGGKAPAKSRGLAIIGGEERRLASGVMQQA